MVIIMHRSASAHLMALVLIIPFCILNAVLSDEVQSLEKSASSQLTLESYAEEIRQGVKDLDYPEDTARAIEQMVSQWKDDKGDSFLFVLKQKIVQARNQYIKKEITKDELARIEMEAAVQLGRKVKKELTPDEHTFSLEVVARDKKANCLGYAQLFYILGNSIGLKIIPIPIELKYDDSEQFRSSHIACRVDLVDGKTMFVDLLEEFISEPFVFQEQYRNNGNFWEIRNEKNPLALAPIIHVKDKDGLIADIYNSRGCDCKRSEFAQGIPYYDKAIALDAKCHSAYYNRGKVYFTLNQYQRAIQDYDKAIELNPNIARFYLCRGIALSLMKQNKKAIFDYTKAIELNQKDSDAYISRGNSFLFTNRYELAKADYDKALELDPTKAYAYLGRGSVGLILGDSEKAEKDFQQSSTLDPSLMEDIKAIHEKISKMKVVNKQDATTKIETVNKPKRQRILKRLR